MESAGIKPVAVFFIELRLDKFHEIRGIVRAAEAGLCGERRGYGFFILWAL